MTFRAPIAALRWGIRAGWRVLRALAWVAIAPADPEQDLEQLRRRAWLELMARRD